jgi:hypothetical protein
LDLSLKSGFDLGLKRYLHFSAVPEWEKKVVKWAKKVVWIGIDKMPLHDKFDIIDIPNYYEFTQNKDVCMSNRVGFASRCETRKSPHFLDGVDSYVFTDTHDFNWWKKNLNLKFEKTRVYQFNYNNLHRFFNRDDWGISHSCFLNEPFGYSIFQSLDYGKLPILQNDWCEEYEYPFRALTKQEFDQQIKNISELSEKERQDYLDGLRDYCRQYDNKEEWVEKYLQIYNDMYFENIGTEKVTIGLRLRMGECTLNSLLKTYPSVFLNKLDDGSYDMEDQNSHFLPQYLKGAEGEPGTQDKVQHFQPLGKGMKYDRNYVTNDRKGVVLIRDVLDKWKSGYYQNLQTKLQKMYPPSSNNLGKFLSFFQPFSQNLFNTFVDVDSDMLDIIAEMHDVNNDLSWMISHHANFWQWNDNNDISLMKMSEYEDIYFLELKDLSNPKFLEWLRKQDKAWEGVKSIDRVSSSGNIGGWHKKLHQYKDGIIDKQDMWGCFTPPGFWSSMDLFWKEYKEGKILKGKVLACPFYELEGNKLISLTTGIGEDLFEKVKKEQDIVDSIRENHERYISKLL